METDATIKILVADDHEIYRDGLLQHFSGHSRYSIVGTCINGIELVQKATLLEPHVVLTDLKMPLLDGPSAIRSIARTHPAIRCIVLTSYENDLLIVEALEAGAKGYLNKNMPKQELFYAIEQVCRGYPYYCLSTSSKMVRLIGRSQFNPYTDFPKAEFSVTERRIIQLICEEKNNREIASLLFLSIRTVENHRHRILNKMHAKTPAGVAIYAIKHSLFLLNE
ncbi:MAG: response regulator transcription factor [Chitinophagaceae bacterium]|nr:response regulator transcription factor [Chitinophagaceae bacterium]